MSALATLRMGGRWVVVSFGTHLACYFVSGDMHLPPKGMMQTCPFKTSYLQQLSEVRRPRLGDRLMSC